MFRTYQPKKRQRSKVHGFRARMKTKSGRNVLKARPQDPVRISQMTGKDKPATAGSQGFSRAVRLGGNRNYRYVYRKGKSYPSRNLTLVYCKGRGVRVGFSVSSKVGGAVTRNHIRRILREDVRKMLTGMKAGRYVFVARPSARNIAHEKLTTELTGVIRRAGLFREDAP